MNKYSKFPAEVVRELHPLFKGLSWVSAALSKDECRPAICHICVEKKGLEWTLVATDRIHPLDDRWERYLAAYAEAKRSGNPMVSQGSISREMAVRMSERVIWTAPKGCRKPLPDLAALLYAIPTQGEIL